MRPSPARATTTSRCVRRATPSRRILREHEPALLQLLPLSRQLAQLTVEITDPLVVGRILGDRVVQGRLLAGDAFEPALDPDELLAGGATVALRPCRRRLRRRGR